MKAVILAGGFGTRITEESITRPKPMVEIGGRPILWHLMKVYSSFGINEFNFDRHGDSLRRWMRSFSRAGVSCVFSLREA